MTTQKPKHKIGAKIRLTEESLVPYGEKWRARELTVSAIATRYMPAKEFFATGKPAGFHPGYDESAGCALYDLKGLSFSLYEWEIA